MPETPADKARKTIDDLLGKAGWLVQPKDQANITAGRGVAICNFPLKFTDTEFQSVTPDAKSKTHFILIDAVGLDEEEMTDTRPLDRKRHVSFEKLLQAVAFGNREPDVLSSLASRLARLDNQLSKEDRKVVEALNGGRPISTITSALVNALDPDVQMEAARAALVGAGGARPGEPVPEPTADEIGKAGAALLDEAAKPIAANPDLRNKLVQIKTFYEQTIDIVSKDELQEAGFSADALERARSIVESFEQFIRENKDEITALQVLYSRPYSQRLTFKQIKELADAIERPPRTWTPAAVWRAYETLDKSKVRGSGGRLLTDIVSLVRFALHQEGELRPFRDEVNERFDKWLAEQETVGAHGMRPRQFTPEQRQWLGMIRDHIASSLAIEAEDFEYVPFAQHGGLGKAYQVFGKELQPLLDDLNNALAA